MMTPSSQCLKRKRNSRFKNHDLSYIKDRLNNSTLRWSQIQLDKTWSTSKSSQIPSVLIQTWITRVLYTQERSRWLQMFCTMFFCLAKLPQTSSSFSKTSRSAKTKFQHLEAWWRAESSALHHTISNKTNTKNFDEITRKPCNAESPATNVCTRWKPNVPIANQYPHSDQEIKMGITIDKLSRSQIPLPVQCPDSPRIDEDGRHVVQN